MILVPMEPEVLDGIILVGKITKDWKRLWKGVGKGNVPRWEYYLLRRRYFEKQRGYHDLYHVDSCLEEFREVKHLAERPNELEIALWYHDIIYDPKAKDNEYRSANIAYEICRKQSMDEESSRYVSDLILLTKHEPEKTIDSIDGQFLVDMDLSIFGKDEDTFDKYEEGIAKEYAWVVKEYGQRFYNTKRAEVLSGFKDRNPIYLTEHFREKYEKMAKQNLERSIEKLSK